MSILSVNWLSILVTGIVAMGVGFAWYSPAVFGKPWMKLIGKTQKDLDAKKDEMPKLFATMFLGTLVSAFVISQFIRLLGINSALSGAVLGFAGWLGFIVPTSWGGFAFEGRPLKLFYLENGHHLAGLVIMGAILGAWH